MSFFAGVRNRLLRLRLALRRRLARRDPLYTVDLVAPPWFNRLLGDDIQGTDSAPENKSDFSLLAISDDLDMGSSRPKSPSGNGGTAVVGYRARTDLVLDPAPFIQTRLSSPVRAKDVSWLPDEFRSLAASAQRITPPAPDGDDTNQISDWIDRSREAHLRYREAIARTSHDFLRDAAEVSGLALDPIDDSVTVVCVTNRPGQLGEILENYRRQTHADRRLLIVANSDAFDPAELDHQVGSSANATWIQVPEDRTLGHCLNQALERCTTRFLAKFDDDDHYGANYLSDALLCHKFTSAAVVGKHTYFVYSESQDITALRFPGHEFAYTSFVAGGTLLIDISQVDGLRFEDRTVGEDTSFLLACQKAGKDVFAGDRYNYLQVRGKDNTWAVPDRRMLSTALKLAEGRELGVVDI